VASRADGVQRCNDVFEEIIPVSTEEEANAFFQSVDRYDPVNGPLRKLRSKLRDLYWTFAPPVCPGPVIVTDLEGTQTIDTSGKAASGRTPPERVLSEEGGGLGAGAAGVDMPSGNVPSGNGAEDGHGPEEGEEQQNGGNSARNEQVRGPDGGSADGAATPQPAAVQNAAANASNGAGGSASPDNHKVFICLALGRRRHWRLRYAEFTGQNNKPEKVVDAVLFDRVQAEVGKFMKERPWPYRFLFPLTISSVEFYEVSTEHKQA